MRKRNVKIIIIYLCWLLGLIIGGTLSRFIDENYQMKFLIWQEFLKKPRMDEKLVILLFIRKIMLPMTFSVSFFILTPRWIYLFGILFGTYYGLGMGLIALTGFARRFNIIFVITGIIQIYAYYYLLERRNLWKFFLILMANIAIEVFVLWLAFL